MQVCNGWQYSSTLVVAVVVEVSSSSTSSSHHDDRTWIISGWCPGAPPGARLTSGANSNQQLLPVILLRGEQADA